MNEIEEAQRRINEKAKQTVISVDGVSVRDTADSAQDFESEIAQRLSRLATQAADPAFTEQRRAEEHRFSVQSLRLDWGVPKLHCESVVDVDSNQEPYKSFNATLAKLKLRAATGYLVALVGIRGAGKTQIGVELMRQATDKLRTAYFCSVMDFFIEIKSTYRKDAQLTEAKVIEEYCKPQLLVIDEIHERSDSAWEDSLLFHLINKRYNAVKDTLVISNLSADELAKSLRPSIVRRMADTGGIIECNWGRIEPKHT